MLTSLQKDRPFAARTIDTLPDYPKIPLGLLLFFAGYVLIWYLQVGIRVAPLGAIRLEFVWAVLLICWIAIEPEASFPDTPLTVPTLLLIFVMALMVVFSYVPKTSWGVFFDRVIKFAFMGFFISCCVKSPRDLKVFLGSFLLACGKMCQEGVHGQVTGSLVWQNQGVMRLHGPTPLYRHPNSFSGMALGTIPFIIYLWAHAGKYIKLYLAFLFSAAVIIVLFTGSRTGYFAFLVMLLIIFFRSKHKVKILLMMLVITPVVLHYIPQQYKDRFASSFTSYHNKETSAGKRVQILEDAVAIFFEHPFGVGLGAFPAVRQKKFGRMQDTHNLYLEVLTNTGVQGFAVFLFFIVKMLLVLKQLENELSHQLEVIHGIKKHYPPSLQLKKHEDELKLIQAVSRAVFLFIMIRLGLGMFGMDMYEIYWWFAAGLTIALFQMNTIAEKKTDYFLSQVAD